MLTVRMTLRGASCRRAGGAAPSECCRLIGPSQVSRLRADDFAPSRTAKNSLPSSFSRDVDVHKALAWTVPDRDCSTSVPLTDTTSHDYLEGAGVERQTTNITTDANARQSMLQDASQLAALAADDDPSVHTL
eukprot:1348161-Pyramimonas_sp.AAC.2